MHGFELVTVFGLGAACLIYVSFKQFNKHPGIPCSRQSFYLGSFISVLLPLPITPGNNRHHTGVTT